MQRCEFITLLGSVAARGARAQQQPLLVDWISQ